MGENDSVIEGSNLKEREGEGGGSSGQRCETLQ